MIEGGMRVLVTGGAGFIGSHLVERLLRDGARVTVIDNLVTGSAANLAAVRDRIEFAQADVRGELLGGRIDVRRFDLIVHAAANSYIPPSVENPVYDFEQNLHATVLLLEALRAAGAAAPRLVNLSSAGVYGDPLCLPMRELDPTIPISPYGVSKLAAERYVAVYSATYGLRASSLRVFSVYGPRQRKQVVFDLLRQVCEHPDRMQVIGDGTQARDFGFVLDIVEGIVVTATRAPGKGEALNVASGRTHTIAELAEAIGRVCGAKPAISYTGRVRPGDSQRWVADISALRALGYEPRYSLEAGLKEVRIWHETLAHSL